MHVSSLDRRLDPNPRLPLTLTLFPTSILTRTQREAGERGRSRQVRRVGGRRVAEDGRRGAFAAAAVSADRVPAEYLVPDPPPAPV